LKPIRITPGNGLAENWEVDSLPIYRAERHYCQFGIKKQASLAAVVPLPRGTAAFRGSAFP